LTSQAVEDLSALGATMVEMDIPRFEEMIHGKDKSDPWRLWCNTFRFDFNNYLASLGPEAPYKNLGEVVASGLHLPYIDGRMKNALEQDLNPVERNCASVKLEAKNQEFRNAIQAAMDESGVDAFVYPTWTNQPRKIGDMDSPDGNNSPHLSPHTGMPAITVPTGFTNDHGLPAGLTFIAKEFEEGKLIRYTYAYEQGTQRRKPPAQFGPLTSE
jgi:Asp-tRNA(Asn)/Glu-tRNA(Gln) amidotransferase A subunit family amidase